MTENVFEDPHKLVFIQSRAEIDFSTVDEYAQMMLDGIVFDPVEGVQDEQGAIYVWDGYHRGEAAKKAEMSLLVNLRPGSKIEAEWLALTANQKHGLRRSRADKLRIVRQALLHPYGVNLSNSEIGRHCGISDKTVARIRQEMEVSSEIPKIDKRIVTRNGVSYAQDTRNIGSISTQHEGASESTPDRGSRPVESYWSDKGAQPQQSSDYEPAAQEFECPRCGREKIVGINGSRRWCLACDAEWPTAAAFLAEVETHPNQEARRLKLERLQRRFTNLLARVDDQELDRVDSWLDDLERSLAPAEEVVPCYVV